MVLTHQNPLGGSSLLIPCAFLSSCAPWWPFRYVIECLFAILARIFSTDIELYLAASLVHCVSERLRFIVCAHCESSQITFSQRPEYSYLIDFIYINYA